LSERNPALTRAWVGFLQFAIGEPELRSAFGAATGIALEPTPVVAIDAMICAAPVSQSDRAWRDFLLWVTLYHWGHEGVPARFFAEARTRFESSSR